MSLDPIPVALVFALQGAGGPILSRLIEQSPRLCATEAIGALLLPAVYARRTQGTDADYDALAAGRQLRLLFAQHPHLHEHWCQSHRTLVSGMAHGLHQANPGSCSVVDHFHGNHFAAAELAELLPDALAVIVLPQPILLLCQAYEASGRSVPRLRKAEARYRDLSVGPANLAVATEAFAGRALLIDQSLLESDPAAVQQALDHFIHSRVATRLPASPPARLPASLAADTTFTALLTAYMNELEPVLPRLGTDAATLTTLWRNHQHQTLFESILTGLDPDRFASIGISREDIAVALCNQILPSGPDAAATTHRALAALVNSTGEALHGRGEIARAHEAIRFATELDPGFTPALNNLGVIAWQDGLQREAADHFLRAFIAEPSNRVTLHNLVDALIVLGETEQARTFLSRYLSLHPDDDEILSRFLQL